MKRLQKHSDTTTTLKVWRLQHTTNVNIATIIRAVRPTDQTIDTIHRTIKHTSKKQTPLTPNLEKLRISGDQNLLLKQFIPDHRVQDGRNLYAGSANRIL